MRRGIAAAILAAALVTGCSDDEPARGDSTPVMPGTATTVRASPITSSTSPKVLAPTDTGHSKTGDIDIMILSVEDADSRYGPVTVVTFQLVNTGTAVWEGYNWPTPTLVYGPPGAIAERTVSLSEGYGKGVAGAVPPGARQTVKEAYKVTKAELNPTVITVGSVLWQGDFSTFQR